MADQRHGMRDDVRGACYTHVRQCMARNLSDYYVAHPERLLDQRSVEKVEMMRVVLACILGILDGYNISERTAK